MAKLDTEAALIVQALERLTRLMRADEHGHGLNPAQREALRYLSRANRFSNSPGALTRYLGATKGTISQSIKALERKGFVTKSVREGEKRSVFIAITEKGLEALDGNSWSRLAVKAGKLGDKTRRRMAKGLRDLLQAEVKRGGHHSFGQCATCRFFRERGAEDNPLGPHQCMLLDEPLSGSDSAKICVEHEAAA